jgi:hypothetical protein
MDYYAYPVRFVDKTAQTGLEAEVEDASVDYGAYEGWLALEDAPAVTNNFSLYQRKRL